MKAMRIHSYGGGEVLTLEEAPLPELERGDILVRVHAASINPFDWKVREGYLAGYINHKFPLILGLDLSGTVEALGPDVTDIQVGDEVFGQADIDRNGSYAEFIAIPATKVAPKPQSLDHVQTAALPNTALAAWNALIVAADLQPGQILLVHGAAGGVGIFAIQLAKWRGARVVGTASPHNHDFLRQLGAEQVIDYNTTRFEDVIHDADVVLDTFGGETQQRSWKTLKAGGMLVSIIEPPSAELASEYKARPGFAVAEGGSQRLRQIAALADEGVIHPVISAVYPLEHVRQAHDQSQGMHTRGKLVIQLKQ